MSSIVRFIAGLSVAGALAACAPVSSSTIADGASAGPAWTGKVHVSQEAPSNDIDHQVIGTVKAEARAGYGSVESLYPLLADEARKMGANGVVGVTGGRKVSAASWSAPHASGTAIKVSNPADMDGLQGASY